MSNSARVRISDIIGEKRQSAPTSLVAGIGPGLTMSIFY
jgi:hypothetical protein